MSGISALNPIVTRDGMRAAFNASDDGLNAKITHIALGDERYTPDGFETGLRNERHRIPVLGGRYVDDFNIEINALLDDGPAFEIAEVGIILEDGTLLAVWSDPTTPMAQFTPGVPLAFNYVLALSGLPTGVIEVSGDVDLNLFFGSEWAQLGGGILSLLSLSVGHGDRLGALERRVQADRILYAMQEQLSRRVSVVDARNYDGEFAQLAAVAINSLHQNTLLADRIAALERRMEADRTVYSSLESLSHQLTALKTEIYQLANGETQP
ncbi:phage tail-collar fiber domain-containing protein [Flexibacterium corallicola]|uniref:phage tail-collar fiber domain-containing protein n=1 Tax=Flexibacterium corallicola TaxID=3037259 RepID=UPI00286F0D76|nr:phage tail protein [Pseudovibrio sp. M1P-2-3]